MVHLPRPDVPEGFPDNDAFATWAGPGAILLEGAGLDTSDFTGEGPFVVRCFHGTTHRFDRFDSSVRGNIEGQFGAMHYFSTCPDDAWTNYASEKGPDLRNRIEALAERLANEAEDSDDVDALVARTREAAKQQLVGGGAYLLDCVVRFERPFLLGTPRRWPVPNLTGWDSFEPLDPSLDPDEDEDAYFESMDAARMSQIEVLLTAFSTAADALGLDTTPELPDALVDDRFDGTATDLETIIQNATSYLEHQDTGELVSSAFFAQVVRALGFDAIVLLNADHRFRNMGMNTGTAHVHLFDGAGANVKFFEAARFDPEDDTLSN